MASDSSVISISQKRRERKQEGGDKGEGIRWEKRLDEWGKEKRRGKETSQFHQFQVSCDYGTSVLKTHTWVVSDIGKGELFSSGEFVFLEGGCSLETPLRWHAQRTENVYHCLL